jgi:hypothetical protein
MAGMDTSIRALLAALCLPCLQGDDTVRVIRVELMACVTSGREWGACTLSGRP